MKPLKGGEANSLGLGEKEFGPSQREVISPSDVGTKSSHLGAVTTGTTVSWGSGCQKLFS